MKNICMILLAISLPFYVNAQTDRDSIFDMESAIDIIDVLPEFPGGEEARLQFLKDNVKYPKEAREYGISGRVIVSLIVEPDGSITNVKIVRSVHPLLDEEAIRVTKLMPKWKPGKQRGKPVRVQYTMPIIFTLE